LIKQTDKYPYSIHSIGYLINFCLRINKYYFSWLLYTTLYTFRDSSIKYINFLTFHVKIYFFISELPYVKQTQSSPVRSKYKTKLGYTLDEIIENKFLVREVDKLRYNLKNDSKNDMLLKNRYIKITEKITNIITEVISNNKKIFTQWEKDFFKIHIRTASNDEIKRNTVIYESYKLFQRAKKIMLLIKNKTLF